MKLIAKILYMAAKWFWPDLAQWEEESCRACDAAASAAKKLRVSIHRNEIEPRWEFDQLIAGEGTLLKLMRGPFPRRPAPSGEAQGERP